MVLVIYVVLGMLKNFVFRFCKIFLLLVGVEKKLVDFLKMKICFLECENKCNMVFYIN